MTDESLNTKLDVILEIMAENKAALARMEPALKRTHEAVTKAKEEMESIWKRVLAKTMIIHGISDQAEKTTNQTEEKVKNIAKKLGMTSFDVDIARRMGTYSFDKNS